MLPEHMAMLRQLWGEFDFEAKPLLEVQIEEFDQRVLYAMEYNLPVKITTWNNGSTYEFKGQTHYVDPIKKELRLRSETDGQAYIKLNDIIAVEVIE
jgi:hypothetical protein